jgi:biopolymer transport protein ExbB/TolQ
VNSPLIATIVGMLIASAEVFLYAILMQLYLNAVRLVPSRLESLPIY